MNDVLGTFVDMIVSIVIMFIAPVIICSAIEDRLEQEYVNNVTAGFARIIGVKGEITADDYETFIDRLEAAGHIYEPEIRCGKLIYEPVYRDDVFTGEVREYRADIYNAAIVDAVRTYGRFVFMYDDLVYVRINGRNGRSTFEYRVINSGGTG